MHAITETDTVGLLPNHPWARQFQVIGYRDGGFSCIPHGFFRTWLDEEPDYGTFYLGRCSAFGVGSIARYDSDMHCLRVGRFVAGGLRLRFLLGGQHDTRTISTCMFSIYGMGLKNASVPQYGDSIIKNDVWIGDETMMLGGGIVENGCIIGAQSRLSPNFRSEPYGVYAGAPARLLSFRFPEPIREALIDLEWWNLPLTWIHQNNDFFLLDLTADEGESLEALAELKRRKATFLSQPPQPATPLAEAVR